jgi:ferredoxin
LVQFSVSRNVFLDKVRNGQVERFVGPIRSIVLFDAEDPVTDGSGGVVYLTETWREQVMALSDFTDTRPAVNRQRYCTYIPDQEWDEEECGLCIQYCPSGAVGSSAPKEDGEYTGAVKREVSRFSDGHLQFNFARCLDDRTQKAKLYPDYVCARCMVICAARGKRRATFLGG